MAMNGTDILLLVNTGTPGLPVYEAVGCQRDVTFEETTEEIDASCKDARAKRVLAGRYSATISLDSVYVPTCDAYQALKDAMRDGDLILVAREEQGVTIETANALVTTLSTAAPDQDVATVSVSLTVDGEWTEVGT
jgi:predicted secreted protein